MAGGATVYMIVGGRPPGNRTKESKCRMAIRVTSVKDRILVAY
jgi:hypothetical protein